MIDRAGYEKVDQVAQLTKQAVERGAWKTATALWADTESVILKVTGNIDFYNILSKVKIDYLRNVGKLLTDPTSIGSMYSFLFLIL